MRTYALTSTQIETRPTTPGRTPSRRCRTTPGTCRREHQPLSWVALVAEAYLSVSPQRASRQRFQSRTTSNHPHGPALLAGASGDVGPALEALVRARRDPGARLGHRAAPRLPKKAGLVGAVRRRLEAACEIEPPRRASRQGNLRRQFFDRGRPSAFDPIGGALSRRPTHPRCQSHVSRLDAE